jgi:hypothetical protein
MKFISTISAINGKSYHYGGKSGYGDVSAVNNEDSPLNKKLISEVKKMNREPANKQYHPTKKEEYILGSVYNGTKASLIGLSGDLSSKMINPMNGVKKPERNENLNEAMKQKDQAKRIYGPSILF